MVDRPAAGVEEEGTEDAEDDLPEAGTCHIYAHKQSLGTHTR